MQNFRVTVKTVDPDFELTTINKESEYVEKSDFKEDLDKLRQIHCDSTLKLYRNRKNKPV